MTHSAAWLSISACAGAADAVPPSITFLRCAEVGGDEPGRGPLLSEATLSGGRLRDGAEAPPSGPERGFASDGIDMVLLTVEPPSLVLDGLVCVAADLQQSVQVKRSTLCGVRRVER